MSCLQSILNNENRIEYRAVKFDPLENGKFTILTLLIQKKQLFYSISSRI